MRLWYFVLCHLLGRHDWHTFDVGRRCRRCGHIELWSDF